MKRMAVVVECPVCGNLSKEKIIPRAIQGDLFDENKGVVVDGVFDKSTTEKTCARCNASLSSPEARVYVVYELAQVA